MSEHVIICTRADVGIGIIMVELDGRHHRHHGDRCGKRHQETIEKKDVPQFAHEPKGNHTHAVHHGANEHHGPGAKPVA